MTVESFRLRGCRGELNCVYYPAASGVRIGASVLLVPPFSWELSHSRRWMASLGRRLASLGTGVLNVDPFGCGDSDGEHVDALWSTWREDLGTSARWLAREAGPVILCGLGLGGLLAAEFAAAKEAELVAGVVLVKPVVDGRTFVRRLLILHSLDPASSARLADCREVLQRTGVLNVHGYPASHEFLSALAGLSLPALGPRIRRPVTWLETGAGLPGTGVAEARHLWREWESLGVRFRSHLVSVPAPWELETEEQARVLHALVEDAVLSV